MAVFMWHTKTNGWGPFTANIFRRAARYKRKTVLRNVFDAHAARCYTHKKIKKVGTQNGEEIMSL